MSANKLVAYARVMLPVEIMVHDTWGVECTVQQIHKQAYESAINMLNRMAKENYRPPFKVVGEPKITTFIVNQFEE